MKEDSLILVVDDNSQNVQVLGSLLESNGYRVAIAMSGKQALVFMESNQPDLILLDVMMPELNGYEVCKSLKAKEDTELIPVIFLTANSDTENLVKGFEAGGVDYITKPFNTVELLTRVKTQIKLKKTIEENLALRGIIPICANCKKIKNDEGYWQQVEIYIEKHSKVEFSHGLCEDCNKKLYGETDWYKRAEARKKTDKK